jgi:hypothetical protein
MWRGATDDQEATMLTTEQIITYCEREIAARYLAGEQEQLRRMQLALAVLASAADDVGDRDTAMRFRVLAAKSANHQEALAGNDD